jgi:hypothetical protein
MYQEGKNARHKSEAQTSADGAGVGGSRRKPAEAQDPQAQKPLTGADAQQASDGAKVKRANEPPTTLRREARDQTKESRRMKKKQEAGTKGKEAARAKRKEAKTMKRRAAMRTKKKEKTIDDILLAITGVRVVHQDPIFDDMIVKRGKLLKPTDVRRVEGSRNGCHANCAGYYVILNGAARIMTGYYLVQGYWRPHSWLHAQVDKRDQIIETTCEGDLYFGFTLNAKETADFVMCEVLPCLEDFRSFEDNNSRENQSDS